MTIIIYKIKAHLHLYSNKTKITMINSNTFLVKILKINKNYTHLTIIVNKVIKNSKLILLGNFKIK